MALIEFKNINKTFTEAGREIEIFHDLSLNLDNESKNIILGTSGSGKSTFLNLLTAMDDPSSGEIIACNENLSKLNQNQKTLFRRKNIGFIFQFFNLLPTLTVQENILLPLELNEVLSKSTKDYAFGLLDEVGLADRLAAYPDKLSGGEQQRVAIVRALVHKPAIIVADEPTGNLDKQTADKIIALLSKLISETKSTLVMATHDASLAELADSILEVKDKGIKVKVG